MDNIQLGRDRATKILTALSEAHLNHYTKPIHVIPLYGPFSEDGIGYCPYAFLDSKDNLYSLTIRTSTTDYIKIHPRLLKTNIRHSSSYNAQHLLMLVYYWGRKCGPLTYIFKDIPSTRVTKGRKYHVFEEKNVKNAEGVLTFDQLLKLL